MFRLLYPEVHCTLILHTNATVKGINNEKFYTRQHTFDFSDFYTDIYMHYEMISHSKLFIKEQQMSCSSVVAFHVVGLWFGKVTKVK